VHPDEVAPVTVGAQPAADLLIDVVGGELGRAVLGQTGDRLLQAVPGALAVGREVERLVDRGSS
jgi:hypothetical protein